MEQRFDIVIDVDRGEQPTPELIIPDNHAEFQRVVEIHVGDERS